MEQTFYAAGKDFNTYEDALEAAKLAVLGYNKPYKVYKLVALVEREQPALKVTEVR